MISRRESSDLIAIVKMRERVTKAAVDTLAADRKADVLRQLSTIYHADEEQWKDITSEADRACKEADAQLARICEARGIPAEFRPELHMHWYGRGQNAVQARRAELQAAAFAKIDADRKAGHRTIEAWSVDKCVTLIAGQLTSDEAKSFLETLPNPESLLPPITIRAALDRVAP